MKCPKCGEEMSSGICLKCGYIQTYENLDDAFSQYTNYASDLKSSPKRNGRHTKPTLLQPSRSL